MGLMDGKRGLILGVANDHSIAWGIAQALHREGARLGFNYVGEALEKRVRPLADSLGAELIEPCDVTSDEQIAALMARTAEVFGQIDFLVHAIAYAGKDELSGAFINTTRNGFRMAMEISVYSLIALTKAAEPLLAPGASILTLTYYGSEKVMANYNVMGVAKSALESSVRYLAADLGLQNVRVNAISAGAIRTLAASGIAGFRALHKHVADHSALRRSVTIHDVGNAALYLCSDLAAGVTGEVHYVDAGFNIMGPRKGEE